MKKQEKKTAPRLSFDLGLILLLTGGLANVTIWIGAFVSSEASGPIGNWVHNVLLPILGGISGLAMGITVTGGLVYVLARINRMKPSSERKVKGTKKKYQSIPNVRYYTAWGAIILLLVISPALLAPYVYMTISGTVSLFAVLGATGAGVWSVGRVLAADLALAAIAMVHGVQLPALAPATQARTTTEKPSHSEPDASTSSDTAAPAPKAAPAAATGATYPAELRPCDVPGCKISYKWPQGKGAHYKKYHKDLVIQKGIPAKVSLPLKVEK
jgi:hypothetical protein